MTSHYPFADRPGRPAAAASTDRLYPAGAAAAPAIRIDSPAEVLAAVPYLVGFSPDRSLVVIGTRPPRDRIHVTVRYDLPDPPERGHARDIAAHATAVLTRQHVTMTVLAGYGPGALVTPVVQELRARLAEAGIELREALRAEDGRYWSYLCSNPSCCPAEGVGYDIPSSIVAAEMTAAGAVALPGRAALEATITPLGDPERTAMRQATARAERRAQTLIAQEARAGSKRHELRALADSGLRAVSEAISTYRSGNRIANHDKIAWLALTLADLRVRDDAWARMDPKHTDAHLRLWTDLVRRAEPRYTPAPASLLAFTAWQAGNGALANVAIARALEADPGYSLALLLFEALSAGLPPSAARLPMTPEEVADAYAKQDGARRPGQAGGHGRRP